MRNPLLVALDLADPERALELARKLAGAVAGFKIGSELFTRSGPGLVAKLRELRKDVFLDLKYHDIPNTVAKAVAAAVKLDVQMVTVHTSGGRQMLEAAEQSAKETAEQAGCPPPLVLGVTVLTSLDSAGLAEVGVESHVGRQVERLANLAINAGLRGLVCSPLEVAGLRQTLPPSTKLVTPGIRPPGSAADDQRRTLSAREAIAAGADWLVVGRPIYAAADPRAAAESMLESLQ